MTQCEFESWWVGYVWHQLGTKTNSHQAKTLSLRPSTRDSPSYPVW